MFTIGIALHAFNAFIASTTMPSASLELGTAQLLSWATSAYLVASIVGGAAAAVCKARFGSRPVLLASSVAFILGTLAFGLAQSAPPLIAGRILQGAGEGMVMALCYTLIPEMFPKALVPRIFALESVVWAMAALGGPSIAGVVTEFVSWRAAVLISVPVSLGFMALVPLCVPAGRNGNGAGRIPVPQLALVAAGVVLLSVGGSPLIALATIAGGVALLGAAVVLDARSASRLFPARAFHLSDSVGAGMLLILLMSMAEAPSGVFSAFAGQTLWSLSVLESGLLAAVVAMSWSVTAIAVAHMPRLSTRAHVWPAPLVLAAGCALFVVAIQQGSLTAAIVSQILTGASFGFSWARLCEHVMEAAPPAERDFAVGALPTIQFAGISIGAALSGTIAHWAGLDAGQASTAVAAALAPVFVAAAALSLAATLVSRRAA
jgi:MFS family permease